MNVFATWISDSNSANIRPVNASRIFQCHIGVWLCALMFWTCGPSTAVASSELPTEFTVNASSSKPMDIVTSPNHQLFATLEGDGVGIWNMASKRLLRRLDTSAEYIARAIFLDDTTVLVSEMYGAVTVWNTVSGLKLADLATGNREPGRAAFVAISADRRYFVINEMSVQAPQMRLFLSSDLSELPLPNQLNKSIPTQFVGADRIVRITFLKRKK